MQTIQAGKADLSKQGDTLMEFAMQQELTYLRLMQMGRPFCMPASQAAGKAYNAALEDLEFISKPNFQPRYAAQQKLFIMSAKTVAWMHPRLVRATQPVFRSGEFDVVYSDIVAMGATCVLLELANNQQKTQLRLEPGRKNKTPVQISLYKGEGLFEKLLLQARVCWDLDGFAPGEYRLDFGPYKSFQFSIQE